MKIEKQLELKDVRVLKPLEGDSPKEVVLIDFSWLLHKSFWGYKQLSAEVGGVTVFTGDIYGVLRAVGSLATRKPKAIIFLVLDGTKNWRKESCPEYKAGRDDEVKKDVYLKVPEILQGACCLPNVFITYNDNSEADDVLFTLASKFSALNLEVAIHSVDKDLFQAIGGKVRMFDKIRGNLEYTTEEEVKKAMGVAPQFLPMFRSLTGDSSDNLSGYLRIPKAVAALLSEHYRTPEELLSVCPISLGLPPAAQKWTMKIREEPDLLARNFKIMKLAPISPVRICRCEGSFAILEKYRLHSIVNLWRSLLAENCDTHVVVNTATGQHEAIPTV